MTGSASTCVVYVTATGEIVHVHHTTVVPGATAPSGEEIEANAIRCATTATRRSAQELSILSIDRSDLHRGHRYSVDLTKKELRKLPRT